MRLAKEGTRELLIATAVLAVGAWGLSLLHPAAAVPAVVVWAWVLSFFRDPERKRDYEPGEFCAPADGTVTEVSRLDDEPTIGGPALRVGIFLSIFDVHINRSPCTGTVREVLYKPGRFLDARHRDSGTLNEANTLVIEPTPPLAGPVIVRQVAGLIARRIVCHAGAGSVLGRGERFGMIKFGSRTELIVPQGEGTEVTVEVGDKVKAGLTVMLRQQASAVHSGVEQSDESHPHRPISAPA